LPFERVRDVLADEFDLLAAARRTSLDLKSHAPSILLYRLVNLLRTDAASSPHFRANRFYILQQLLFPAIFLNRHGGLFLKLLRKTEK
jgi:hypothetical protein